MNRVMNSFLLGHQAGSDGYKRSCRVSIIIDNIYLPRYTLSHSSVIDTCWSLAVGLATAMDVRFLSSGSCARAL